MTREPDLEALAEALELADRRTWADRILAAVGRRVRRALVKGWPFALAALAGTVALAVVGVDLGWLLMVMFYGSPVIAVAVVSFVAHAWRQNSTTAVYGVGQEVGQAEPGQVADQIGQPAQDVEVGQVARVAKPAPPTTVTVTVLPAPVAELTQVPTRPGQGDTVYPTVPEEEIA